MRARPNSGITQAPGSRLIRRLRPRRPAASIWAVCSGSRVASAGSVP